MARASRALLSVDTGWRLLAPLLITALLVTTDAGVPSAVDAGGAGTVAAIRQRQLRTEATMSRADKQIKRLQAQRGRHAKRFKAAKRRLDRAIARRDAARVRAGRLTARLEHQELVLARTLRVRPNPAGKQISDKPSLRKRVRLLAAREAKAARRVKKLERKVEVARKRKQQARKRISHGRILRRVEARERAEDRLAVSIIAMLQLSKERASARLATATRSGFKKPAAGRISQRYGCTGYRANPRVGRCRHFHDGIDIATRRGAKVRAAASGYVAFVGRNPWDVGRRSFIVIIGHARGYETVYAHLKPVRKVRAGQRVARGQVIGVVGMTGHTTGPHVHWEVKKHGRAVDPARAGR